MNTSQDSNPIPKKKTLVIALIIVVVVALSIIAIVAVSSRRGENHDHNWYIGRMAIPGGYRVEFYGSPAPTIKWGDLSSIQFSDGTNTICWLNLTTADLTSLNRSSITWHYGSAKMLGSLSIWLNITDRKGDGCIGSGDYLGWTAGDSRFSATEIYYVTLLLRDGGSLLSVSVPR